MKFAGWEPEEEFCVIHIAERFAVNFGTRKRSFTYNVNSTGPKMDPCGTPAVRGRGLARYPES